jgi:hypothetical protein
VYFGKVEDRNIHLGAQNSDLERKVGHKEPCFLENNVWSIVNTDYAEELYSRVISTELKEDGLGKLLVKRQPLLIDHVRGEKAKCVSASSPSQPICTPGPQTHKVLVVMHSQRLPKQANKSSPSQTKPTPSHKTIPL